MCGRWISSIKPTGSKNIILYYIQKEFLDIGLVAFPDEFEAWPFGPAIPDVYDTFCGFGAMPIHMKYDINICGEYKSIIDKVVIMKEKMEFWDMVADINHENNAWYQVYKDGIGFHQIIPKALIKSPK